LRPEDREFLFAELSAVAAEFPKVYLPQMILEGYRNPPRSPSECTFARLTTLASPRICRPVSARASSAANRFAPNAAV